MREKAEKWRMKGGRKWNLLEGLNLTIEFILSHLSVE